MENKEFKRHIREILKKPGGKEMAENMLLDLQRVMEEEAKYEEMTNEQLACELTSRIWSRFPIFTGETILIDVVVNRLKKCSQ